MPMLPLEQWVLTQVGHVGGARTQPRPEDHPTNVGPQQPAVCIVRVKVGIGMPVVRAMSLCPPETRTLDGTCSPRKKEDLQRQ